MDLKDATLLNLATKLTHQPLAPPGYLVEELLVGLGSERLRLGRRPFLVTLYQNDFDYDGLTANVFLMESFDSQAEAIAFTESSALKLLKAQTSGPDSMRKTWGLESEGKIFALPEPGENSGLRVVFDKTYKLRASEYDTIYNCFRVIGPFSDFIVCDKLFDFLNCQSELWRYFVGVGGSIRSGDLPRMPSPTFDDKQLHDQRTRSP
jgi:hypothetical protein